jgi:hypothetical protein
MVATGAPLLLTTHKRRQNYPALARFSSTLLTSPPQYRAYPKLKKTR